MSRVGDISGWSSTTGAVEDPARIPGVLAAQQLFDAPVYFAVGPTGRSLLWPEKLGVLMPETNTTDPGFNAVDLSWVDDDTVVLVQVKSSTYETSNERSEGMLAPVRPLDEVVRELRAKLGMSVEDVAAMCGIKRRQLYNLMAGRSTGTAQEAHLRRLDELVLRLWDAVDRNPDRVRSVVLHPVDGSTFYDAAVNRDSPRLDALATSLMTLIREGAVRGAVHRPSPRRRRHARPGAVSEAYGDDSSE